MTEVQPPHDDDRLGPGDPEPTTSMFAVAPPSSASNAAAAARAGARADAAHEAAERAQRTAEAAKRDIPVGVIMVGMSAVAWWPAFTLGAWGELFFDDIMGLWAASVAAFVFVLVERAPIWRRLLRAVALTLPSVWVIVNFSVHRENIANDPASVVVDVIGFAAVIIGIPFTLVVLVRIIWPDFRSETSRRWRWLITLVVAGVAVTSFVLGLNQAKFLNCEDFDVSGNSRPPGCVPLETPSPDPSTPA